VIADASKRVDHLGAFGVPIEVNRFGLAATMAACERAGQALGLAGQLALRLKNGAPFVTDGGHLIIDASFGRIPDPNALQHALRDIPGVVETGLFIGLCDMAIVASPAGIEILTA
jgi:ribose 5-phosphate isomerase A